MWLMRTKVLGFIALTGCWFACCQVQAQAVKGQKSSPNAAPQPDDTKSPSAAASAELAKKSEILNSERWRSMQKEFEQWLAVQVIYTPQQVQRLKAKLAAEVKNMSVPELERFMIEWDEKLEVLHGKDAAEAREWLGQNLSMMADGYRRQFLQQLGIGDVSQMTAAQIEEKLYDLRAQRLGFEQERANFNVGRQNAMQRAQQFHADQRAVLQASGVGQAAGMGTYQTQYGPRQYNYQPAPPIIPFFW
jgi:hypothetical protein